MEKFPPSLLAFALAASALNSYPVYAQQGKWSQRLGTAADVAQIAGSGYLAYRAYKDGKRLERIEGEIERNANAPAQAAPPAPPAAPAAPEFVERVVRGDGTGMQAIVETSPGACMLRVKVSSSYSPGGYRWDDAFETPCDSSIKSSRPQFAFDVVDDACVLKTIISTSGGNGTYQRVTDATLADCGFHDEWKSILVPDVDKDTVEGVCKRITYEDSTLDHSWERYKKLSAKDEREPDRTKCGFRRTRQYHQLAPRAEGETYPGCRLISEYRVDFATEPYFYKTSAPESDLHKCGIRRVEELSLEETARRAFNLAQIGMAEQRYDERDAPMKLVSDPLSNVARPGDEGSTPGNRPAD